MELLDQLKEVVSSLQQNFKPFDPTTLNDDVAMKTEWTPAKHGGSKGQIYDSSSKLEMKVKPLSYFSPLFLLLPDLYQ